MATKLSPNFTLEELCASDTAKKAKISNVPTEKAMLARLAETAERMEGVRALLGHPIKVNSCFRTAEVNKLVGGVENSDHMSGYSVDFTCAAFGTPYQICKAIVASGLEFDQLIHEKRVWVHISFAPKKRMQTLTLPPLKGAKYLDGLHL